VSDDWREQESRKREAMQKDRLRSKAETPKVNAPATDVTASLLGAGLWSKYAAVNIGFQPKSPCETMTNCSHLD